jgi:hypothetical protein
MINRIVKINKLKVKIYKYLINQLQTLIKTKKFYKYNNNRKNNIKKEKN